MKESIIQKWVRDQLHNEFGPFCIYIKYPASQYSSKGVSDLIFCIYGFYVAIEVKTDVGKLTLLQKRFIENIRTAGGLGYVIYGKDTVLIKEIINDIRRKRILNTT